MKAGKKMKNYFLFIKDDKRKDLILYGTDKELIQKELNKIVKQTLNNGWDVEFIKDGFKLGLQKYYIETKNIEAV